jgi:hypothetical protein
MCSNAFWWTGGNRMFCIIQHGLWRDLLCYGNRLITYIVTPTFNIPPSALWLGDVMTCSPPTSITRQQKLFSRSMTSCFSCSLSDSDRMNLKPESMLTLCIGMHVFVAVCFYRTSSRLQSMVYCRLSGYSHLPWEPLARGYYEWHTARQHLYSIWWMMCTCILKRQYTSTVIQMLFAYTVHTCKV